MPARPQARPLARRGQPRHRLPRSPCRGRAAAPDDAIDQAERGRRALCGGLPAGAHRTRGGRHPGRRRTGGAARHACADGAQSYRANWCCGPVLDAFLDAYPTVSARLLLLDRAVNLIDEGFDAALRIGESGRLVDGRDPDRGGAPGGGGCAALSQAESAHRGAGRSGQAPDHFDGAHPQFLELSARRRAHPSREPFSLRRGS